MAAIFLHTRRGVAIIEPDMEDELAALDLDFDIDWDGIYCCVDCP